MLHAPLGDFSRSRGALPQPSPDLGSPQPRSLGRMTTVVETQRFTTADGAQLCYQLRGDEDAPKLLCVQGSMQDMRKTDAFLASLALRFRVLVYDHRGMGRSTMDVEPAHYSMAGYAADADALLQHLAWSRCHIMGVSFGGMVAQEIALRYPTRLGGPGGDAPGGGERGKERDDGGDPPCSLVLVCTSAGGEAGASALRLPLTPSPNPNPTPTLTPVLTLTLTLNLTRCECAAPRVRAAE